MKPTGDITTQNTRPTIGNKNAYTQLRDAHGNRISRERTGHEDDAPRHAPIRDDDGPPRARGYEVNAEDKAETEPTERIFMARKKVVEIRNWLTGDVIAAGEEGESFSDAVARLVANRVDLSYANLSDANLSYANLSDANLRYANLSDANLRYANLRDANLRYANLRDANLRDANLSYANLSDANLSYANLRDANLRYANLSDANLSDANLPSSTAVLLAYWEDLSPRLVADLMLYDSTCHPDPEAFQRWAEGGACPYSGVRVQRAASFSEKKSLWGRGEPCRPYDLMARVLAERCPDWAAERVAEFEAKFRK